MTTATNRKLQAWDGHVYTSANDWYEKFTTDPEFLEYTEGLDEDELLCLALFAHNGGWGLVPEDMPLFMAQENEARMGEYDSGADFAESIADETGEVTQEFPSWIVIDWETTWKANLCHDFFDYDVIDHNGNYRRFFWNANV